MRKFEFRSANGAVCCSTDNPNYLCAKCKAKLSAGGTHRAMELRTAARPVVKKTASEWRNFYGAKLQGFGSIQPDPPPDPYRPATYPVKTTPCPFDDPHYAAHGEPADGYQIAINRRKETR